MAIAPAEGGGLGEVSRSGGSGPVVPRRTKVAAHGRRLLSWKEQTRHEGDRRLARGPQLRQQQLRQASTAAQDGGGATTARMRPRMNEFEVTVVGAACSPGQSAYGRANPRRSAYGWANPRRKKHIDAGMAAAAMARSEPLPRGTNGRGIQIATLSVSGSWPSAPFFSSLIFVGRPNMALTNEE